MKITPNTKFISLVARTILLAGAALLTANANAEKINPEWLRYSVDGPSTTVAARLDAAGYLSSVGLADPDFGDQTDTELFSMCQSDTPMNWSLQWQAAGYAAHHRLGYYSPTEGVASPSITWVIGGSASGLPNSADTYIEGTFGLAFYSGANRGLNSPIYYSETHLNTVTQRDHLVTIGMRHSQEVAPSCGLLTSWEDAFHIDHDYNDFGVRLDGARPALVPAPAGPLVALAAAGIAGLRRRRACR